MRKTNSKPTKAPLAKNLSLVILGTAVMSFGTAVFIVPFDLVAGGISGIAIIIEEIFGDFVNIDLLIAILTWGLFVFGAIFLGKGFAAKTLISTVFYPIFFSLFHALSSPDALGGYFYLKGEGASVNILIAAALGGVLVGSGCALAFLGGGSTGGVDVIALSICKVKGSLSAARIFLITDTVISVLGAFVIRNLTVSVLGIFSAYVSARAVAKIYDERLYKPKDY